MDWLPGKKTYIIMFCMAVYGIGLIVNGQMELGVKTILEALGGSAIRAGVTKSGPM